MRRYLAGALPPTEGSRPLTVAIRMLFIVWFCTPGGFMAGLISAVVTAAIGFLVLRDKPDQAH